MFREFTSVTSDSVQRHRIIFNDVSANILLRYSPQTQQWFIDCEVGSKAAYGIRLSVGTLHMVSRNMPIDFIVVDNSGNGIDPFQSNDFTSGRCTLYIVDDEGMEKVRGQAVEV